MPLLPFSPRVIRRPAVRKRGVLIGLPKLNARMGGNTMPGKGPQTMTSRMASPRMPTLRQPRGRRP
jgi:hypothetical protein